MMKLLLHRNMYVHENVHIYKCVQNFRLQIFSKKKYKKRNRGKYLF